LAEKLVAAYDRVEQIGKEQDLYRLAKSAEVGLTRAEHIRWTIRTYLGELDPEVFMAPEVDEAESIVPKDDVDETGTSGAFAKDNSKATPSEAPSEAGAKVDGNTVPPGVAGDGAVKDVVTSEARV